MNQNEDENEERAPYRETMEWNGTVSVSLYFTSMFFTIVPASLDKSAALSNDGTGGSRPSRALNQAHGSGIHKAG